MLKKLHFATLFLLIARSQGQLGFISLDCGLPENSTYTEATTKISYISDATFVEGGESKSVLPEHKLNTQQQGKILRSFPQGTRNCYNVMAEMGTKYLIRATFYHGNYDSKNSTPEFDLHLGPNFWETVRFEDVSVAVVKEVIHFPVRNRFQVCLVNTGSGTPFINALEFRPLKNLTYTVPSAESLVLVFRMDIGSTTNSTYRYPYDAFDRLWVPYSHSEWKLLETSETVDEVSHINYQPPNIVMNNAGTPVNASRPFTFEFTSADTKSGYFLYMHFAEIQKLDANESRAFNVVLNGRPWFGPVSPSYLTSNTVYSNLAITGKVNYTVTLEKLENSTMPPIVNAIEVFVLLDLPNSETEQIDVEAVTKIKSIHGLTKNWGGDPCLPLNYTWTGLNCSISGLSAPRITSLNLSSSGLSGEIPTHIANLSMLDSLDLSNNNLTGSVPKFLTNLTNLKVLNLAQNKLTGVVPTELIEKSKSGFLFLSVVENPDLCLSLPCNRNKKNKVIIPIIASIGGFFAVLAIAVAFFVSLKRKKKQGSNHGMQSFEPTKRQFVYSEIVKITKNFDRVLGKGGFGTVYHGVLDDGTEVAVKQIRSDEPANGSQVRSESGIEGKRTWQISNFKQRHVIIVSEVKLLLTVYHGNLTSLVGYCNQGTERVLIYEYMANGDLESYLSGNQGKVLSWETRIRIAIDSAQGLEYLHSGCKPPIIHRDIKPANILITENYRAKLADFGLSKFFVTNDVTHIFTMNLAGTFGYMDPELANNGMVNEKSDVYSFGVVLLQIITSRPTISTNDKGERRHIKDWMCSMLDNGNIKNIVDERLRGDFEINSVWKVVEIAVACVSATGTNRPNMTNVAIELRESLALELDRKRNRDSTDFRQDDQMSSLILTTEFRPLAR